MDEYTAEVFANRGEPIPAIKVNKDRSGSGRDKKGHHKRTPSLQDRIFSKLLQQVIPADEHFESEDDGEHDDLSTAKVLERPTFSLPLMTNNFRRFNARIGVVFVFQSKAIRLFSWQRPTQTLSFLAIYSFVCLYPYLLVLLPQCLVLFYVMIPAFLARHPPPPDPNFTASAHYALHGPPIAPAKVIKPATEMSQDFFRNMRDLQNCMGDFSVLHDLIIDYLTPLTNFSREDVSSAVFTVLTVSTFGLYLISPVLPWRHIFLVLGWGLVALGHPYVQSLVQANYAEHVEPLTQDSETRFDRWVKNEITLDEQPEVLEVEIFELQRRCGTTVFSAAPAASYADASSDIFGYPVGPDEDGELPDNRYYTEEYGGAPAPEWEGWLFSPSAWEPQAPARVAGERPKGTRFFEDVSAPDGWEWSSKKWRLDLDSTEWVQERMLEGIEVEVEGERWVYDMRSDAKADGERPVGGAGIKGRGEWRRRRWVRNVRRTKVRDAETVKVLTGDTTPKKKNF